MVEPAGGMDIGLAVGKFTEIAKQFTDDQVFWDSGTVRREPGLYPKVRAQLRVQAKGLSSAVPASRAPASVTCMSWLVSVDRTVGGWADRTGADTVTALRDLASDDYGPDDCDELLRRTHRLELLAREGLQLVGDAPVVVPVRRPCPRCSELWAYRRGDDGANLRTWALTVSEAGAKCGACDGHWSDLNWLARLLDGEPAGITA